MNPAIFVNQLSVLTQTCGVKDWAGQVCDLLRAHMEANVLLTEENDEVLSHQLLPGTAVLPDNTNELTAVLRLPVYAGDLRIGWLVLYRLGTDFDADEKLAAEAALAVCTVWMRHLRAQNEFERQRRMEVVKAVLNSLSFSELEATVQVFHVLGGSEGLLIAGRIADRLNMTRSVVVNALRKLEGTGVIETRSLGMKGTYIRVLNPLLLDELNKLKH